MFLGLQKDPLYSFKMQVVFQYSYDHVIEDFLKKNSKSHYYFLNLFQIP